MSIMREVLEQILAVEKPVVIRLASKNTEQVASSSLPAAKFVPGLTVAVRVRKIFYVDFVPELCGNQEEKRRCWDELRWITESDFDGGVDAEKENGDCERHRKSTCTALQFEIGPRCGRKNRGFSFVLECGLDFCLFFWLQDEL